MKLKNHTRSTSNVLQVNIPIPTFRLSDFLECPVCVRQQRNNYELFFCEEKRKTQKGKYVGKFPFSFVFCCFEYVLILIEKMCSVCYGFGNVKRKLAYKVLTQVLIVRLSSRYSTRVMRKKQIKVSSRIMDNAFDDHFTDTYSN